MLREALATYAHEAWSKWMRYLFSQCTPQPDGSLLIPVYNVNRWRRQLNTPYAELPEGEQKSDLVEADRMIQIVDAQGCEHDFHDTANQGGPGSVCV